MALWEPGKSGNPGGRPRIPAEVIDACRAHSMRAIEVLVELMNSATEESVRARAANSILDRAWGKPSQQVEVTGQDGQPLTTSPVLEVIRALAARK